MFVQQQEYCNRVLPVVVPDITIKYLTFSMNLTNRLHRFPCAYCLFNYFMSDAEDVFQINFMKPIENEIEILRCCVFVLQ